MNTSIRYMQELPGEPIGVYTSPTRFARVETPHKDMIHRHLYDGEMNVFTIGHEYSTPDKALVGRVTPNQVYLHYVLGGRGSYNGEPIGAGMGFVSLPHQPHTLISSADDPLHFYWIACYGKRTEAYVAGLGFTPGRLIFPCAFGDEVREILDEIIYREQPERDLTLLMEAALLRCLALHARLDRPQMTEAGRMLDHVERAKQYIHQQMGVVTCDEVARTLNLSRKYLNNLFVRFREQSLQSYIMTVRMNYAADLLMSGEYISKEIAATVGYTDYAQFSKMFKKYHHLAPTDYAKARRQ